MGQAFATISSQMGRYAAYLSAVGGLHVGDILLASFPRSGNTWVRFFLCNLISLQEWNGRDVNLAVVNDTMPALGYNNLLSRWPHTTIPRVVKTHRRYSPLFRARRSVGIVRDPRDVMVSYFHYMRDRKGTYEGSFSQFICHPRYGLEAWFKHYISWRDRWTIALKYEEMRENPAREFSRICDTIEVDASSEVVQEAIARSNIGSFQQTEVAPSRVSAEARFARSGASGQWLRYFDERDVGLYEEVASRFNARLYA